MSAAGSASRPRCAHPTAAGHPCRNYAVADGMCRVHLRLAAEEESERSGDPDPAVHPDPAGAADPGAGRAASDLGGGGPDVGGGGGSGPGPSGGADRGGPTTAGAGARGEGMSVLDALAAVLGDDLAAHLDRIADLVRRRFTGDYEVDEYGLDTDLTDNVLMPLVMPLYRHWWRVASHGREHLPGAVGPVGGPDPSIPDPSTPDPSTPDPSTPDPATPDPSTPDPATPGGGGALVVANHAGTVPADGMMLHVDLWEATGRHPRELGADLVFETPFVGHLARKSGATRAGNVDADALLARDQLVVVFPEGFKGLGKPFGSRYRLERFGRGGFVATALRTGAPIIPTAVVGSEEIWPILWDARQVAKALGLPYFPVVAQMLALPFLGPLALLPLPSKWSITYGAPIDTAHLGPDAADDPMVVFDLADQVRATIQDMLTRIVMGRQSVFF